MSEDRYTRIKVPVIRRYEGAAETPTSPLPSPPLGGGEGDGAAVGGQSPSAPSPHPSGASVGPSMWRRAANFAGAVGTNAIGFVKTGHWFVDPATATARHEICKTKCWRKEEGESGDGWYDRAKDGCSHPQCGCRLDRTAMVSKTTWAHVDCPAGHWRRYLNPVSK